MNNTMKYILSYDIGTGGIKATLFNQKLAVIEKVFIEYQTYFPAPSFQEQKHEDWWNAFCQSTQKLVKTSNVNTDEIEAIVFSGASLVCLPIDKNGMPLMEYVPIWSDKRAEEQTEKFFKKISYDEWYNVTGNGFPAPCYPIFKLMWLKENYPEIFKKTYRVLGTKDYINFKLTGIISTDYSYASGMGCFDLKQKKYREDYLKIADLPLSIFPSPTESKTLIGTLTQKAAQELNLPQKIKVFAGGVDNACTAMGIVGNKNNAAYISLGTSSWIPVNTTEPITDTKTKPYTFIHIDDKLYTSAYSIFSGGNSLRWLRDTFFANCSYDDLTEMAKTSPIGSNGVIFQPGLAGGTTQDKSIHLRGGFLGLTLASTKSDLIRSVYEGIALNLRISLDLLKKKTEVTSPILFCGGGSKSAFWLKIFADIFNLETAKTPVDQEAATLGAASCAAVGLGWFNDYSAISELNEISYLATPTDENVKKYNLLYPLFKTLTEHAADYGAAIHKIMKL